MYIHPTQIKRTDKKWGKKTQCFLTKLIDQKKAVNLRKNRRLLIHEFILISKQDEKQEVVIFLFLF